MDVVENILLAILCGLWVVEYIGDRRLEKKLDAVLARRERRQPKPEAVEA